MTRSHSNHGVNLCYEVYLENAQSVCTSQINFASSIVVVDRCRRECRDAAALRRAQGGEPSRTTSRPTASTTWRTGFATPTQISAGRQAGLGGNFVVRRLLAASIVPRTFEAPRIANDGAALRAGTVNRSVTWVGHATVLLQLDGVNVLTDPNWSERASPLTWAGPRRLSPPGLAFQDLPRIDAVIISHDHYDHLDLDTVKRLAETHDPLFLVPLGMKAWFADNGMSRVEELDWWQEHEYRGIRFVCLPAQHFSQRTWWDGNRRVVGVMGSPEP